MYESLSILNLIRFLTVASVLIIISWYGVTRQPTTADADRNSLRIQLERENPVKTTGRIGTYYIRQSDLVIKTGPLTAAKPRVDIEDLVVGQSYQVELTDLALGWHLVDSPKNQNPRQVVITAGVVNVVSFKVSEK